MRGKKIEAILFDFGETLVNFGKIEPAKIFAEAAGLSYDYLQRLGQPVGGVKSYIWRNLWGLRLRSFTANMAGKDFDSLKVLTKYGTKRGFHLNQQQWEQLNWLWYEPLYSRAWIEPDLAETLSELAGTGLKLGIVSNTFVNGSALDRHLSEEGLLDYFPVRIYSYQVGMRKPDKRIFLEAARQMGTEPGAIMCVGDRINKDIKGALRAGMRAVLKTAHTNIGKRPPSGVIRINTISELPGLVKKNNVTTSPEPSVDKTDDGGTTGSEKSTDGAGRETAGLRIEELPKSSNRNKEDSGFGAEYKTHPSS